MAVQILTIGKLKKTGLSSLLEEYVGRIDRMCPCQVRFLRESRYRDEARDGAMILEEEGRRFLEAIPDGTHCILLDQAGKAMDSVEFSRFLERLLTSERREVALVVGGFLGVSEAVRKRADTRLSLSAMTLPHEIALLVLAEQVYRALTIARRIPYHK